MIVNTANKCRCCEVPKIPVRLEITKVYTLGGAYYDEDYGWGTSDETTVYCQIVYSDDSVYPFTGKMQHINRNIDFANGQAVVVWQYDRIVAGVTELWLRDGETSGIPYVPSRPTNFEGYVARLAGKYTDSRNNVYANLSVTFQFTPIQDGYIDDMKYYPINYYNADGSPLAYVPFDRVVVVNGVEQ